MPTTSTLRATLALLVLPAALAAQATSDSLAARPIALRDAVALAEQNGLASIQARGQIRSAESGVRAARGALLPNLSISLGQVNQSGERLDAQGRLVPYLATQPWTYSTGLTSSINLFDGGRRWNEV
jgi:outer membrane protein TolC